MSAVYDVAIVGSGFAGSLLAMIARRLGRSVVMIEKQKHPRFAIGESSTPLSNLLLEELAERYDLPRLKPLTKWGTWQQTYPELACGLKRGFSFYHHRWDDPAPEFPRDRQLLVAASPSDAIADTHWYRPDVDHFFVREAQEAGVEYFEEVDLRHMHEAAECIRLEGTRAGKPISFSATFLVDATGPRGFIHRALNLNELSFPDFPNTQALYSHFTGVARFESRGFKETPPYRIDDAALHHVFEGGWIWVLRFNNGLTSAGVAATHAVADRLQFAEGEAAWDRLLKQLPAVKAQFQTAQPQREFVHAKKLSFLSETVVGPRWAMLPSAAAFVDPLLSTGFPLTLLGVARLAQIIELHWDSARFQSSLQSYSSRLRNEANSAARLIGALYANMTNFPAFASLSLLYFAAASFAETARRLNKHHLASSFLLCDNRAFNSSFEAICERSRTVKSSQQLNDFNADILSAIEPFNIAGFGLKERENWYPVNTNDLLPAAAKLDSSREEITRMLERCGFESHSYDWIQVAG